MKKEKKEDLGQAELVIQFKPIKECTVYHISSQGESEARNETHWRPPASCECASTIRTQEAGSSAGQ